MKLIIPLTLFLVILGVSAANGARIVAKELTRAPECTPFVPEVTAPETVYTETTSLPDHLYGGNGFDVSVPRTFSVDWRDDDSLLITSPDYETSEYEVTNGFSLIFETTNVPEDWTWREWATRGRGAIGPVREASIKTMNGRDVYYINVSGFGMGDTFRTEQSVIEWTFPYPDETRVVAVILKAKTDLVNEEMLRQAEDIISTISWNE